MMSHDPILRSILTTVSVATEAAGENILTLTSKVRGPLARLDAFGRRLVILGQAIDCDVMQEHR